VDNSFLREIQSDFKLFLPLILKKYVIDKPGFAAMGLKDQDVNFVLRSFRRNCTCRKDLALFFYHINLEGGFLYRAPYPTVGSWDSFMDVFALEKKHFTVVYKLLVDVSGLVMRGEN